MQWWLEMIQATFPTLYSMSDRWAVAKSVEKGSVGSASTIMHKECARHALTVSTRSSRSSGFANHENIICDIALPMK